MFHVFYSVEKSYYVSKLLKCLMLGDKYYFTVLIKYTYIDSTSRFDVEKECEAIDGNIKNDPPIITNTRRPKISAHVDTSCNALCTSHV